MKNKFFTALFFLIIAACTQKPERAIENKSIQIIDSTEMTNNFYDNTETFRLAVKELTIEGEILNPGKVDFTSLPRHSVIVKETLLDSTGSDRFVGAYRYDGYSLFDILEKRIVKKVNSEEFNQVIDMFIEIENEKGEKVVFSWGEIYYPNDLHNIIIADGVSRIVPSKTKEMWPLPSESRIVAGNDLITERNISSPVKITVRSSPRSFKVIKGLSPMYAEMAGIYQSGKKLALIADYPENSCEITYNTVFYGRGRGIHSTEPFSGLLLRDLLAPYFLLTRDNIQKGILCIAAEDGYRCAVSFSELFNRNDQQEFLLIKTNPGEEGGLFRMFPAADFFSDRAVKSVKEIHLDF